MGDQIGSLQTGKLADIVTVDGDPMEDMGAMQRVHGVIKGGLLVARGDAVVWPPALNFDL